MKKIALSITLGFSLIASSCATLTDAQLARGTGTTRTYSQPYSETWNQTIAVVKSSKLDLVSAHKESGVILAQRGMSFFSQGENVAIFVKAASEASTHVEVINKLSMATNVFAPDRENILIKQLDTTLIALPKPTESSPKP